MIKVPKFRKEGRRYETSRTGRNKLRSLNQPQTLAGTFEQHFADKADIELVEIKELPIFNKPANRELPEIVKELVAKI